MCEYEGVKIPADKRSIRNLYQKLCWLVRDFKICVNLCKSEKRNLAIVVQCIFKFYSKDFFKLLNRGNSETMNPYVK